VCLTTLSVAGQWMKSIETNWRKEIVKAVGNDTAPASDLVFTQFTSSWLQGPMLDLPQPSQMLQSHLIESPGKRFRRYATNRPSVSLIIRNYFEFRSACISILTNCFSRHLLSRVLHYKYHLHYNVHRARSRIEVVALLGESQTQRHRS
jgi:hypothetical protein